MKKLSTLLCLLLLLSITQAQILQRYDILPSTSSKPRPFVVFNDKLLFYQQSTNSWPNPPSGAFSLWEIDSIGNFHSIPNTNVFGPPQSYYATGAILNDTLYLRGVNSNYDQMIVRYDGNNPPYEIDAFPGEKNYQPEFITALNNKIYFFAQKNGNRVFACYTPTTGATNIVKSTIDSINVYDLHVYNDKIFYFKTYGPTKYKLCYYDPVTNKDSVVLNITFNKTGWWEVHDNKLYFQGDDGINGFQLYEYDGTTSPVRIDITRPVPDSLFYYQHLDKQLVLFFYNLKSPGVPPSPQHLYNYNFNSNKAELLSTATTNYEFITYKDRLYYCADDTAHGYELWVYDGISPPALAVDINPGAGHGTPQFFTVYKDWLYFGAYDANGDHELYRFYDFPTNIQNIRFDGNITIYPNPARDEIQFSLTLEKTESLSITLTDISGKNVSVSQPQQFKKGVNIHTVPINTLAAGPYFYTITNEKGQLYASGKVIKE